jgi:hypothetical protein
MVANKILIATLAVNLRGETVRITSALGTAHGSHDDGEAGEDFAYGAALQPAGHG